MTTASAERHRPAMRRVVLWVLTIVVLALATSCGSSNHSASPPSTSTTVAASSQANPSSSSAAVSTLLKQGLSQASAKQLGQAETTFKNVLLLDPQECLRPL